MARPQPTSHQQPPQPNGAASFTVFRVPGARYPSVSSSTSSTSSGPGAGIPLTVGPSMTGNHRTSYSSTLPASPQRESYAVGFDDYEGLDGVEGQGYGRVGRIVRVKETGESYRFPLDEEYLPQMHLSRQNVLRLRETMERHIDRAVRHGGVSWMDNPTLAQANNKYQWKVHLEKKGSVMYRRKNDPTLTRHFLVRAKLDCSLNDAMFGVMNDNTEDERTLLAHLFRDDFLDGSVVQLIARPTREDPYQLFAIKWAAFQSPVDSMYAVRDQLFVEYSRTVSEPNGQRVVARVVQSINAKDFETSELSFGFVRNEVSWVQLFRVVPGSNDKRVDLSMSGSLTFPSEVNTPSWLANRFLSSMYSLVAGIPLAGDSKHIVNHSLVSDKPWVPNSERSACNVCFKSFGLLRHRHHCRICAEIMCTSCTLELALRSVHLPAMLRPEGGLVSAEKFCLKCIEQGRKDRGDIVARIAAAAASMTIQEQQEEEPPDNDRNKENRSASHDSNVAPAPSAHSGQSVSSSRSSTDPRENELLMNGPSLANTNVTAWSNKVLKASAKERTASSAAAPSATYNPLRARTHTAEVDRLRVEPESKPIRTASSLPTELGGDDSTIMDLPRESEDVMSVTPLPSTFARMEESIAVQQQLLRTMIIEGQKMMQQQQHQHAAYPPQTYAGAPPAPALEQGAPRTAPLALPPSTTGSS
ncbi:hypothetical protein ATCC90586_001926 [Pythium insidiosum]|nr:hypothetical protein ATCC90586_001926 [Pythium insidiosum]